MFWIVFLRIIEVLIGLLILFGIIALTQKPTSIYKNQPEQQNPLEGKKVVFIQSDNS